VSSKNAGKTAPSSLLIVDDDPLIGESLRYILSRDFQVTLSESRQHAIALVRQMDTPPDLALVDLGLPPTPHQPDEGFALIGELLAHAPNMQILVLSGQNAEAHARHARTLGAIDFIPKPSEPQEIRATLLRALEMALGRARAESGAGKRLVGASAAMDRLAQQLRQFAPAPFPVLITGESGSGKELAAAFLHQHSGRSARPYLALNCAAISPTLVEPTLFGYSKGAFTGATQAKAGYFEEASEGTLFLDEIGELPLDLQAKLLRVLENGEYQRVGETTTHISRARIVAATNRDLRRETREGRFRTDLYHRLSVFTVNVPPLRELGDDRLLLLEHYTRTYAQQSNTRPFWFSPPALERWRKYTFPGNVRELRNLVIRLQTKYPGMEVDSLELSDELDVTDTVELRPERDPYSPMSFDGALRLLQQGEHFSLDSTLRQVERSLIDAALKLTRGNVSQAAKMLGINRTTLYSRLDLIQQSDISHGDGQGPA
jgi:DNA-binding NtrC family response regulator